MTDGELSWIDQQIDQLSGFQTDAIRYGQQNIHYDYPANSDIHAPQVISNQVIS